MARDLQGLRKDIAKKMKERDLGGVLKEKGKAQVMDAINDMIVSMLKDSGLEQWVAEQVAAAAKAVGFDLVLTDIRNKDTTKANFDTAITAKINALAGTTFTSIQTINREEIYTQVGALVGAQLGLGPLFPVNNFRDAMGTQLLAAFDSAGASPGPGGPQGGASLGGLFNSGTVQAIEKKVVSQWRDISTKAVETGNPMSKAGPPRDAAHAAQRAGNRKRQARYRSKHVLRWVPMGEGGESTGNGREGLTGKDSGNEKPVRRWLTGPEF